MKKTILTVALITAMLITGCASDGTADNTKNDATTADESNTGFDSAVFIEEITPNVLIHVWTRYSLHHRTSEQAI